MRWRITSLFNYVAHVDLLISHLELRLILCELEAQNFQLRPSSFRQLPLA